MMLLVYPAGEIRDCPLYRDGLDTVFCRDWLDNGFSILREVDPTTGQLVRNGKYAKRFAIIDAETEADHDDHAPSDPEDLCPLCRAAGWVTLYEYMFGGVE